MYKIYYVNKCKSFLYYPSSPTSASGVLSQPPWSIISKTNIKLITYHPPVTAIKSILSTLPVRISPADEQGVALCDLDCDRCDYVGVSE